MPDHIIQFQVIADPVVKHRLQCLRCDGRTLHRVLTAVHEHGEHSAGDVRWWSQYEIVQCQGCESVSFRQDSQNTESYSISDSDQMVLDHHEELFPHRLGGRKELPDLQYLPAAIQTVYRETHAAHASQLRLLAGIGIRALVEAVCKEKGTAGRTLEDRVGNLVTAGLLTPAGAQILQGTKLFGAKNTHEQQPLAMDLLSAAMEVVEHLLRSVYVLPRIAGDLPGRAQPVDSGLEF
jgi:hypothetical protein